MSAENKAVVRSLIEAFDSGDVSRTRQFVASDLVLRLPGAEARGVDAWLQLASSYHTAFPDIHTEIEDLIAEGDKVVVRCTAHATHNGDFMGVAASGRSVTIPWMMIARVRDGEIQEAWEEFDLLGIFQAIGKLPSIVAGV